jgi:hypothetical protein
MWGPVDVLLGEKGEAPLVFVHIAIALFAGIAAAPVLWGYGLLPALIGIPIVSSIAVVACATVLSWGWSQRRNRVLAASARDASASAADNIFPTPSIVETTASSEGVVPSKV